MNKQQNNTALMLSAATLAGFLAFGGISSAKAEQALTKSDVEKIIETYLKDNPEVILESVENYRQQQEKNAQQEASKNIEKHLKHLTSTSAPSVGNPEADVTIVEFFDYNCGYCKKALPDIQTILDEDKNVRFVFQELPILSPASLAAAKWALAAQKQDKYFEYHSALMNHRGAKNESTLEKIAKDLELDLDQMRKNANSKEIAAMIEKNRMVTRDIGVRGTPAFIVNGELMRGYIGEAGLKAGIKAARDKKG